MTLTLIIEEDFCFRECIDCEDEIPDPYLEEDEEEDVQVLCSTCDAERTRYARLKRLKQQHLKPPGLGEAICNCGYRLPDCTVATCHQPDPPPKGKSKKPKVPPRDGQGSLFR